MCAGLRPEFRHVARWAGTALASKYAWRSIKASFTWRSFALDESGIDSVGVQLLTPQGARVDHPDFSITLTDDELRRLLRDMTLVRRLDLEATALQRQGELGLWASCLGQEASQVGSASAMAASDFAFPTFRDHGVAWVRGVAPLELLAMLRGVTNGGWDVHRYRCAPSTIVIGNQALHAVGYAMGIGLDGSSEAAIGYFGDGATAQGDVNEAFVFAAVFNAPVVFFCQNNQWAISLPTDRQTRNPIHERAAGFGFPGIRVDGNDVLAVMAVTRHALDRARAGEGPTLIEAFTYRMAAHTTSDDPTRYRPAAELDAWRQRDPIERLTIYLVNEGMADESFLEELEREADELGELVRAGVRAMTDPPPGAMFDNVYAEPHPEIDAQRAEMADYLGSFIDEGVR